MTRLIERLQEAITDQVSVYRITALSAADAEEQISQQQAIYDQIIDLAVRILRLVPAHRPDG